VNGVTNWFYRVAQTAPKPGVYGKITEHGRVEDMQVYRCVWDLADLGDEEAVLAAAEKLKSGFIAAAGNPWPTTAEEPSPMYES
jgi:hypothetical protein